MLGICAGTLDVAYPAAPALAVAASAGPPTILHSLFRKRFTTRGALWSVCGGPGSSVLPVLLSPVVPGKETSMFPGADFHWFPLENPGPVSIPPGFPLGRVGSPLSGDEEATGPKYAEPEVRSPTGAGAH